MKKLIPLTLAIMLLTLWATSAALAVVTVPAPHNYECLTCHNSPTGVADLTNAAGINNVCLTCHNPAITPKAFSPKDLANPFGSTALGVYTSGRKQTSHNWFAPVNVPAAGAALPILLQTSPTINTTVNCGTCHDPHTNVNGHFLRIANDMDQVCLDCHRSRNTTDQTKGTHPVMINYAATAAAHPTAFYSPPRNANPANPTSAMKLIGGLVLCTTCHGVHFTDSNARTYDSYSSSTFGRLSSSQGYLLRTDLRGGTANAVNICTNCHAGKLAHNRNGQNIQCADCHAGHVDPGDGSRPNVWLVRRYMNYSSGNQLNSYRRKVFNQYTGSQSNWAGANGVCQACHSVPPPGGSFPAEHASTDPNVCRGCHVHESTTGSFSANCTGCHGFPPQANTAGGPQGYAKTPSYDYAATTAFKDESRTPHVVHAGKAPYTYGCSECHLGNRHATGNFQQVFNTKTGIIASTGGAVPTYNTDSPGTCSNVYCHSNGAPAGGATAYKSPTWANAKDSIVGTPGECNACHDAMPATNAHPGHLSFGFACALCHAATVSSNTTIKDTNKHVNGIKDVMFSGTATIGGSGFYDGTTHTCSTLYCHSNGNQGALIYANPAAWNSGVNYGCNGCHGTSSSIGAPDYANGGAGTVTANTHGPHVTGATTTTVCANCHFATASSTAGGTLAADSKHLTGAVDIDFNPATAGSAAAWNSATGTCSNVACHGGAPAQWGSTAACLTCHSFAINGRAAIGPQFGANSHHVQGTSVTAANCYQCHWEANSDGSINHTYHHSSVSGSPVELVIYGAGTRPTAYGSATAIQYTANGTRTEIAKINSHCLGCHSDQNNTATPFGDGKTPKQYAWDGASIATKYSDLLTTPWSKYSGGNVTPKNTVTKAFSAHGNAAANQAGWNLNETWPNTTGTVAVLCFDCHNSHGSTVSGTTTSYASATTNGGILKDTVAGKGGYSTTYQPKAGGTAAEHNLYNPGAGLCFDCHQSASAGTTPWGYTSTFSASQAILGYLDKPYFSNDAGQSGFQMRNPYKINVNFGGHLGATSPLSAAPSHAIGGLCTPCHDPHGVSPTLAPNKQYGVPLLKGTWMTSPYKDDDAPVDNATYGFISGVRGDEKPRPAAGAYAAYTSVIKSYKIDQNTFASGSITETDQQFAGLCLNCHAKQTLTDGVTHTWKDKNRIHESVKGWKTANATIKHNYSCSKCHAPHTATLPRLMITNCLDYKHRGRVTNNANPVLSFSYRGDEGYGGGHIPGIYSGISQENSGGSTSGTGPVNSSFSTCHEGNTGSPTDQYWNVKTPWTSGAATPFLASPMLVAEPNAICSGSCGVQLQWNAVTNTGGGAVQYLVQVSSSSTFATVNYSSGWISGTSWSVTLPNGTWYWRVQARDSVKTTTVSAWTVADSFILSTNPPPSKPLLIAEPNATCSGSCGTQLQWNPSTNPTGGAVQYSVQVSSDISFATVNYSSGWITGTSWTPTLGTGTWYWRVQARSAVNTSLISAWSLANSFILSATTSSGPTVPVLITEPNATCSGSCATTLQWNASTNTGGASVQYQVQVSSSSTFSTINFTSGWITATSYTPTLTNGTWYWRVQARDSVTTSNISAWSAVGSFTLSASTSTNPPTAPVLIAEPDGRCSSSSGCSISLQWNASTNPSGGSIQYLVQVSSGSSFSSIRTSSYWQTGTSWTDTLPRGTWYWRVQARDAAVTTRVSPWSSVDSFILN